MAKESLIYEKKKYPDVLAKAMINDEFKTELLIYCY